MKQKILGIIPARSGSKGIKDKNIFPLKGKPLIFYTIKEALRSRFLDRVIVSTDSKKYAAIAKTYKAEVPFLRPKGLAEDFSSPMEAIFHALDFFKKKERYIPDIIVWLQPTAPLRKAFHIDEAIKKLLSSRADSLVSLCVLEDPHPYKLKTIKKGFVYPFIKGKDSITHRQLLPRVYRLNGALYMVYRKTLEKYKSLFGQRVLPYIMDEKYSVNIDHLQDIQLAEILLKRS